MDKFVLLTFDLEEFSLPIDYGKKIKTERMLRVSHRGCKPMERLLKDFNIKATFFTTGYFARNFPRIVRKFAKDGHEIALHAVNFYNLDSLKREKKALETTSKSRIIGIRTHKLGLPLFNILRKIGIKYDSSLHPTYVPGRYNNLGYTRKPFKEDGILEISISVTLLRLPFSFIWFRNLGLNYAKICTLLTLRDQNFVNLYFHPWEFVNLKSFDLPFYVTKNTGKKMDKMLREYIEWCLKKGFKFSTMSGHIKMLNRYL